MKIDSIFTSDNLEEEKSDIIRFIQAILTLELEIKAIREDIKDIKSEAKNNKIPVKEINTAIRLCLAELKKTPGELSETEKIKEILDEELDIKQLLHEMIGK